MNAPASQALIEHEPVAVPQRREVASVAQVAMTPMEMAFSLIQNGADLGSVKEMLTVSREIAAEQARRAFDAAVADAKAEIPIVGKNAEGHNKKRYADFSAYASALKPILAKFGLSYRFRTEQTDRITVTCVLSHKDGHSEENSLSGPADASGSKNAIQAIGSTLTYLQRYTLIQALGLAASEDDDGRKADEATEDGPISKEQTVAILRLVEEAGADIEIFCERWKIQAIPELPVRNFKDALASLQRFAAKQEGAR